MNALLVRLRGAAREADPAAARLLAAAVLASTASAGACLLGRDTTSDTADRSDTDAPNSDA